jgi:hypothetical protein
VAALAAIPAGSPAATAVLGVVAVLIVLASFASAIPGVRRLPVIGAPRAELTVVFDPSDDQCVQNRAGHPQPDVQLRLRATNSGAVDVTNLRLRLKGRHNHFARVRHDNTPPYSRSNEGITLRHGQSGYFDIAFCHLHQPQMVLQYADGYLLQEQVLPGNITLKADRTPIAVEIEARRADTDRWLPVVTALCRDRRRRCHHADPERGRQLTDGCVERLRGREDDAPLSSSRWGDEASAHLQPSETTFLADDCIRVIAGLQAHDCFGDIGAVRDGRCQTIPMPRLE